MRICLGGDGSVPGLWVRRAGAVLSPAGLGRGQRSRVFGEEGVVLV